jgi:hypothetical protein
MRKITVLLVMFFLFASAPVHAQTPEPELPEYEAVVQAESGFVRALPTTDSEVVSNVFEDNALIVVGRNLDGTWFQVRRPGRMNNLGWISRNLVMFQFLVEDLPLTDFTTGLEGTTVLTADPGYAVYIVQGAILRDIPLRSGVEIMTLPFNIVVPVIARNQTGSWLQVNYLGTEGWVSIVNVRQTPENVETIPLGKNLPVLSDAPVLIVPPELQMEQLERFRDYIREQEEMTHALEHFWSDVLEGEVMPCEPPSFARDYLYSSQDERQLPELEYLVPRVSEARQRINASIQAMYTCGAKNTLVILGARSDALNARIILQNAMFLTDYVEGIIKDR